MDEAGLLSTLNRLGIRAKRVNRRKGWVDFDCPFPHAADGGGSKFDRTAHAGASFGPGTSAWHCWSCKRKGPLARLIEGMGTYRGADYTTLVTQVRENESNAAFSQDFGAFEDGPLSMEDPLGEPLDDAIFTGLWPDAWEVPQARAYLEARGIGEDTARSLGLMFRDSYPSQREGAAPWVRDDILFPVRDQAGRLYGFTGRTTRAGLEPKVYDPDLPKRHLILGAHRWREGLPLILVEGLFGGAWLVEIGVEAIANIGVIMGSTLTIEKAEIVRFFDVPTYLLFDNDQAGQNGLFGTLHRQEKPDGSVEEWRDTNGAVQLLHGHVPLFLPSWPVWAETTTWRGKTYTEESEKDDPDQLSLDEVKIMLERTPLHGFDLIS